MGDLFSQGQFQSQKQAQVQILSQKQIQALEILSMDGLGLREKILEEVEKNPVLEIDYGISQSTKPSLPSSEEDRNRASDDFKSIIEQKKDDSEESLRKHLLHQLHMERLSETEIKVGEKLIQNLDAQGHHMFEPETLLDRKNPDESPEILERCIRMIQSFDPTGTCTKNVYETLLVQAKQNPDADSLSIFILSGHLDFINPPDAEKALKKIKAFQKERRGMFGLSEEEKRNLSLSITKDDVQHSIDFIRTLNPYPAANFFTEETRYTSPDIRVKELDAVENSLDGQTDDELNANGILKVNGRYWSIKIENGMIPNVKISPRFEKSADMNRDMNRDMKEKLRSGQDFIEMLMNRRLTLKKAAWEIVRIQHEFFEKGPGHLVPLRMKDLAEKIGVSESTVSRMAKWKSLSFDGSTYPVKYFFPAPATSDGTDGNRNLSNDNIKMEIRRILEEHENDGKRLSDQKISELLEQRGVKIARRTVSKYRAELNINSSYDR